MDTASISLTKEELQYLSTLTVNHSKAIEINATFLPKTMVNWDDYADFIRFYNNLEEKLTQAYKKL